MSMPNGRCGRCRQVHEPTIRNHEHWRVGPAAEDRNVALVVVATDAVIVQLVIIDTNPYAVNCLPVA
jgi:hypothetical protein